MPRVEVMAPSTSTRPRWRGVSGSTRAAAMITPMPMGTLTYITQRHETHSTSMPPATRPMAAPPMETAVNRPRARLRSRPSGTLTVSSASTAGAASAAPTPCTAREAMSHSPVVARPPTKEAAVKTSMPARKTRRRPNRSPARAPSSSRPPKARV
ncbi:hypothetical protein ASD06_06880 [Angustibacter sp. Root456]|nr:hypothetical protein ASD06_06880 [Angustibacter sp. Root456]